MATITRTYSDIDLTFSRQPISGDISLVYDDRAVINSVKNLLLTGFYERPFQPSLGSNLNTMLFENMDPLMESTIVTEIKNVLTNFEPRVRLQSIEVLAYPERNGYQATIEFFIGNNTQISQVSLFLERNR